VTPLTIFLGHFYYQSRFWEGRGAQLAIVATLDQVSRLAGGETFSLAHIPRDRRRIAWSDLASTVGPVSTRSRRPSLAAFRQQIARRTSERRHRHAIAAARPGSLRCRGLFRAANASGSSRSRLNTGDDLHRRAAVLASLDVGRWPIRYKDLYASYATAAKMAERRSNLDFRIRNRNQWNLG
jgi:hypothetical protein